MRKDNVINLIHHLKSNSPFSTAQLDELQAFPIEQEKTVLRRSFAFVCDFVLTLTAFNMASLSYAAFVGEFLQPLNGMQKTALIQGSGIASAMVFGVVFFTYFFYCNYVLDGRSLGSSLMGLNVIDDTYPFEESAYDHRPSITQAIKRTFGYMICYMSFGTFFFFSLLSEDKRGLPCVISGTRVVSDEWLKGHKALKLQDQEQVRIDINSLERAA